MSFKTLFSAKRQIAIRISEIAHDKIAMDFLQKRSIAYKLSDQFVTTDSGDGSVGEGVTPDFVAGGCKVLSVARQ